MKNRWKAFDKAAAQESSDKADRFIASDFAGYRNQVANGDKPVAYTLEQHKAIRHMLTMNLGLLYYLTDELAKRVHELEKRPQLRHVGIWTEGKTYSTQNVVTHQGGLWLAKRKTKQRPPHDSWQLVVKSGGAQ